VPGPEADIHISLTGLAPGVEQQCRVWRVDRDNGDAFTAWKAMGSPAMPTRQQIDELVRASRIAARPIQVGPRLSDGSVVLETRLPLQGVELIEVGPLAVGGQR
jgi:xylan 1,4-beta-xylosidase